MRIALRKIRRDLWRNKGRTALVVMSIAAGVMAVGMIVASNTLSTTQLAAANAATLPSHARVNLERGIDEQTLNHLEKLPGVVLADGRLQTGIRWRTSPDEDWQEASLRALTDYENQELDLIELREGSWPGRDDVAVAYNQIDTFHVPALGGVLYIQVNDQERAYPVHGVIRDSTVLAPPFDENPSFFVSKETFAAIAGFDQFVQIRITVPTYSEAAVEAAADQIDRTLSRIDAGVAFYEATDPADHWAQSIMDGVGLILTIMAAASLGLSTFLIVNTVNALMVQQVPQIGMMKTVGGLRAQITTLYLTGVAVYGLLALVVAVPTGAAAGNALSTWMLTFLNVPPAPFGLVAQSFGLQVLTGLLAPLLAGLYPVLRGVAIPVARAIGSYGIGQGQYGRRFLDRTMAAIRGFPRMALLSLRNTFRRPGRVLMTQITLTVAGTVFMMVLSSQQSFLFTIDRIFDGLGFDVLLIFEQDQRIDEIVPIVESRPNVAHAEMWVFTGGFIWPEGSDPALEDLKVEIELRGVPGDSELYTPQIVAGRGLLPEDGHAILLNQAIAADQELTIGDRVVIDLAGKETVWTIVGLILDLGAQAGQRSAYVNRDVLNRDLGNAGRTRALEIAGEINSLEIQQAIEHDLTDYFEARGIAVAYTTTALENKELAIAQFSILLTVLLVMTVLIAAVGGLGLSGTLSINVIERTREIGVMRAVGASSADINKIFMGEGLLLGLVSWLIAIPLSTVAGRYFVAALGTVVDFPFSYEFSSRSVLLWLGIIVAISIGASWLPARRATRISVQESLAYE